MNNNNILTEEEFVYFLTKLTDKEIKIFYKYLIKNYNLSDKDKNSLFNELSKRGLLEKEILKERNINKNKNKNKNKIENKEYSVLVQTLFIFIFVILIFSIPYILSTINISSFFYQKRLDFLKTLTSEEIAEYHKTLDILSDRINNILSFMPFLIILIIIFIVIYKSVYQSEVDSVLYKYNYYLHVKHQKYLDGVLNSSKELTPYEFTNLRHELQQNGSYSFNNYPGVYILFNKSKNMYYVGQASLILDRVSQHFSGRGNGDVYADYKYGDEFTIRMIRLEGSGFSSLNELEREMITKYDSYNNGYNKTRGNLG